MTRKYSFLLRNIDLANFDTEDNGQYIPENATTIDALHSYTKHSSFHSFIDESKKYYITMIDSIMQKQIMGRYCFWDRHPFHTIPIGCPIKWVCDRVVKVYVSEITKEKYAITQHISQSQYERAPLHADKLVKNSYYETDGCFCSFNCCLAFIKDNIKNPLYEDSHHLLMRMYIEIFDGQNIVHIFPAPSWRLLEEYGGHMNIQEFRDSFSNSVYIDINHQVSKLPKKLPIGHVYEENVVF